MSMKWNQHSGQVNTAKFGLFTANGTNYVGLHERVSDTAAKDIRDALDDCMREHLRTQQLQRSIAIDADNDTNVLSMVYFAPLTPMILLPILEFSAPLSLIAAKPDGTREAFLCSEVEKLIRRGERVIEKKFGLK